MQPVRFAKLMVLVNGLVPLALLGWDALQGHLGANPVNFAIRTTGILALIFLIASLVVTPAVNLSGASWLAPTRRLLGLYAFGHTLLHFGLFFGLDRSLSISSTLSEMALRPYLTVGAVGLVIMIPLAITSTNGMIRRLGPRRWKALHRLAYVAAAAGVVHYFMLVKADVSQPVAFGVVLAGLLGYRVVNSERARSWLSSQDAPLPRVVTPASARPRFWSGQLKVDSIRQETPDVRTFRFVPVGGGPLPFTALPGQYMNLMLTIDGEKVRRSYTIASSPHERDYCELSIKREPQGKASRHLHDQLQPGMVLDVSAPAGRFTFTGDEAPGIVMIAGGVGITPLMSKIRYLTARRWAGPIDLLFCVRGEEDIIFRNELEQLAQAHPNLRVHITLTRGSSSWTGECGRWTPERLLSKVPDLTSRRVHYCGPEPMNESVAVMLMELGLPEAQVHSESFMSPQQMTEATAEASAPTETTAAESNGSATAVSSYHVTFARSGQAITVGPDVSVLDAAEDLGLSIPWDCRAGICGTCKVKCTSGEVVMEVEDALSAAEKSKGIILACQARGIGAISVDA